MMFREENLLAFVFCFVSGHDFSRAATGPKMIWALAPEVRLSTVHFRPIGLEKRTPAAKAELARLIFMARVNPCPSLRTFPQPT